MLDDANNYSTVRQRVEAPFFFVCLDCRDCPAHALREIILIPGYNSYTVKTKNADTCRNASQGKISSCEMLEKVGSDGRCWKM